MRLVSAAALLVLVAAPAEARYHRYMHRLHCWPGEIHLLRGGRCVSIHSRAAREIVRYVPPPRFAARPMPMPMPPEKPVAKRQDRLPVSRETAPGVELPYWEPYPIMGRPPGRWWNL